MSLNFPIENLLEWLRTFSTAKNVHVVHDVSDGVVLAKVLHTIAPNHFTDEWLQKLNYDAEINWRLKVSNLKKILKGVVEFLAEGIEDRISVQFLPNLQEIAEHENEESTFRLLQLILACAVNCDNKETYIQIIMGMEETVQQALMEAIQQLMSSRLSIHDTMGLMDYEDRLCKTMEQYKALLIEKEQLAEQCQRLQKEVTSLQEEKCNQQSELNRFKGYFNSFGLNPDILTTATENSTSTSLSSTATTVDSMNKELLTNNTGSMVSSNNQNVNNVLMSPTIANVRISHLQNQLTKLREELYRTECDKEELKIQFTEMTTQNQELKQKCTMLAAKAEESVHLKDELDIAREEAANVIRLSTTIEQLRKHADEAISLRLRCSQLETDNQICMQRLTELEQETRLGGNIRSQVKAQRLQVEDAQFTANEAIKRAELAEQEVHKVRQELISVNREKECIFSELTRLRSCCEGLQSCAQSSNYGNSAMQSQMLNLREELCRLRTSVYSGGDIVISSSSLEDVGISGNPTVDHDIIDAEDSFSMKSNPASGGDSLHLGIASLNKPQEYTSVMNTSLKLLPIESTVNSQLDELQNTPKHTSLLYTNLMLKLTQKEADFIEMEQKYRGYLWKAREVIRLLERQHRQHQEHCSQHHCMNYSTIGREDNIVDENIDTATTTTTNQEINHLRGLLVEKERIIEKLETHHEQMRRHHDAEERILLSAWYNLVIQSTKNTIESNLKQNSSSSTDKLHNTENSMSFLARQRNVHLKPPNDLTSLVMATK
ncbi:hypothetical protein MN116_008090 [Schistosoma mekongi]|uniref:Calponin-homology (CH) domain-containing protein n=1 Tax=Schistosoma mekongi TaxID=38744 RepID=A0AAE1Z6Q3_SCHME|nr:hypothetical protein MN116_008090 [Schistosoma mekongi]